MSYLSLCRTDSGGVTLGWGDGRRECCGHATSCPSPCRTDPEGVTLGVGW